MSDFEVCPVGTLQRLAQVEAERDSMKEILDHIPQVEAELAETSDRLHAVEAERDALAEANEAFGKRQVWWDNKMLALEAERDALRADILFELLSAANYIDTLGGDSKSYRAAIAKAEGGGNG